MAAARAEEIWGEAMVAEVKEGMVAETATVVVVKAEAANGVTDEGEGGGGDGGEVRWRGGKRAVRVGEMVVTARVAEMEVGDGGGGRRWRRGWRC